MLTGGPNDAHAPRATSHVVSEPTTIDIGSLAVPRWYAAEGANRLSYDHAGDRNTARQYRSIELDHMPEAFVAESFEITRSEEPCCRYARRTCRKLLPCPPPWSSSAAAV